MKISRYRRTYHDSPETDDTLSILPGWMGWRQHDSIGYQYINALFGNQAEYAWGIVNDSRNNLTPGSADVNEPYRIWRTQHDTASGNIPPSAYITATMDASIQQLIPSGTVGVDATTIHCINADDQEAFFMAPPTRMSYDPTDNVVPSGVSGIITGLTYVRDWTKVDSSGVVLIPEQDVYIVNQDLQTPQSGDFRSAVVYDTDWVRLDTYDYGLAYQDYDHTGKYELITDPSGYTLEYNPIASTVRVYDYINLDDGTAQVMPTGNYTVTSGTVDYVTTTTIALSGINPWNRYPTEYSSYFLEYQYRKHDYPKQITTSATSWAIQKQASPPIFVSHPTHYAGTIIRHELARSTSGLNMALRVDSRDLRPGSVADIRFDYVAASDVSWGNTSPFSHDLSSDASFLNTTSGGAHIIHDSNDITYYFRPALSGDSTIYIPSLSPAPHSGPLTVRMYYNARGTYEATAVQSFSSMSTGSDPYPMDYMVENGYLIPYSILPLSDGDPYVNASLLSSRADQFTVTTDLIFNGIAYDKDKDCYWILESNNLCLYRVRPSDGATIGKYNIFKVPNYYLSGYVSQASARVDSYNQHYTNYPFLDQEVDVPTRVAAGMVYYRDTLYISSSASGVTVYNKTGSGTGIIGGTGIYRLDTYNERVRDMEWNGTPAETYPHYPAPSGYGTIVDLTLNEEDLLAATTSGILTMGMHYDYTLIDSTVGVTRGTVYYRDQYTDVVVSGYPEWRD